MKPPTPNPKRPTARAARPNAIGTLPATEVIEVTSLPEGYAVRFPLSQYEGLWYAGYEYRSPGDNTAASKGAPNVNGQGYASKLVCLNDAAARAVEYFQGNSSVIKAVEAAIHALENFEPVVGGDEPNEHGVLIGGESFAVPGLPKGCQATYTLRSYRGRWFYGYEFRQGTTASSGMPRVSGQSFQTIRAALLTATMQAVKFFTNTPEGSKAREAVLRFRAEFRMQVPGEPVSQPAPATPRVLAKGLPPMLRTDSPLSVLTPKSPMKDMIPLAKRPVTHRPLKELTIHAAIAEDPRLAAKDSRYLAMQRAWEEQDGCPPIYATASGQIVDGRHRFWWLEKTEAETAPVIEVAEEEVPQIVLGAIVGRNHTTKGQRAYLVANKLTEFFAAAKVRREALLASGGKLRLPALTTPEALCESLGMSEELVRQARKIHDIFNATKAKGGVDGKALRKIWEPLILDGEDPIGLGAAIAGIAGSLATKGSKKAPAKNSALRNFIKGFKNLAEPAAKWLKWDADSQEMARDGLKEAFAQMPEEVLEEVTKAIRAARKEAKKPAAVVPVA